MIQAFLLQARYAFLVLLVTALPLGLLAEESGEKAKIDYLLGAIEHSGAVFIRNGSEHTGKEARSHMEEKLVHAGGRVRTVDDFIIGIASKSSTTGKPYYVRLSDGTEVKAEDWLRAKLREYGAQGSPKQKK